MRDHRLIRRRVLGHAGFTLVELLIAMGILLILTTLSVAVYSTTASADRIRSSARQVQSALGGARDRGIKAVKTDPLARRGLRLLVDAADPTTVSSLVYVGSDAPWTDGQVVVGRFDNYPNTPGMAPSMMSGSPDGNADSPEVRVVRGWPRQNADGTFTRTGWRNLYDQGLLVDGSRIRIPAGDNGIWYTVLTYPLLTYSGTGPEMLVLTSDYRGSTTPGLYGSVAYSPGTQPGRSTTEADLYSDDDQNGVDDNAEERCAPSSNDITDVNALAANVPADDYELELKPTVLPGQDPLRLSSGIAIDLYRSQIPPSWYQQVSLVKGSALPATDQGWNAGTGTYYYNGWGVWSIEGTDPANAANDIYRQYSPRMDIMFSPQGSVANGALTTIGLLHLRLADVQDIGESRDPANPQAAPMLYSSLFPQTGFVGTFPVDITDSNSDGYADDPLKFARIGGIAGR